MCCAWCAFCPASKACFSRSTPPPIAHTTFKLERLFNIGFNLLWFIPIWRWWRPRSAETEITQTRSQLNLCCKADDRVTAKCGFNCLLIGVNCADSGVATFPRNKTRITASSCTPLFLSNPEHRLLWSRWARVFVFVLRETAPLNKQMIVVWFDDYGKQIYTPCSKGPRRHGWMCSGERKANPLIRFLYIYSLKRCSCNKHLF